MRISIEIEVPKLEAVLREARSDRSLYEIGAAAGMSHDNIKLVEGTRKARPNPLVPLPTLLKVAAAVGVDVKIEIIQGLKEVIANLEEAARKAEEQKHLAKFSPPSYLAGVKKLVKRK